MGIGVKLGIFSSTGATVASSFSNTFSTIFDGSDDKAEGASDFESLDGATQATWMFWFKTSSTAKQYVISQWHASSNDNRNLRVEITPSSTKVDIYIGHNISYRATGTTISTGAWHQGVVTYNGSNTGNQRVKFYLDGSSQAQIGFSGPTTLKADPASPFTVAARIGDNFSEFVGHIDEVSIFSAELTAGEVSTYHNSGVPNDLTDESNLIHWWRMGDGDSHPTIEDQVGSYDLTMTNMASDDLVEDVPE